MATQSPPVQPFLTKFNARLLPVGTNLKHRRHSDMDTCPCCGEIEDHIHLVQCQHVSMTTTYNECMATIQEILQGNTTAATINGLTWLLQSFQNPKSATTFSTGWVNEQMLLGPRAFFAGLWLNEWVTAQESYHNSIKTPRSAHLWTAIKSINLEALMTHMESSAICKEAIKSCQSCLMKFPDNSSFLKHKSLKKRCYNTYNISIMDPSIVLKDQQANGENKEVILSNVTFYSSAGKNKQKKLNTSDDVKFPVQGNIVTNSYATYTFPYHYRKTQPSTKYFAHGYTSISGPSETMCSPGPSAKIYDIPDVEYQYGQDVDFPVDSQYNSSYALSVGSNNAEDDEYNEEMEEIDDQSADEDDDHIDVTGDCDSLKILANKIRRRQIDTFHLSPEVQMLMDLYLKTDGRGDSLKTFDDIL